jgi:hypothetical protein
MKNFALLYCLLFLFSCNQAIQPLELEFEQKFVVWCLLHPDSIATALVSKTSNPFGSKEDRIVKDALVLLIENGIALDTLKYIEGATYRSIKNYKPKVGRAYSLRIEKNNYLTATTEVDTIPKAPILIKYITKDSITNIEEGLNLAQLQLFTDNPKYYYVYGLSNGLYKYFNFKGEFGDSYKFWDLKSNDCEKGFYFNGYSFKKPYCDDLSFAYYEYTAENSLRPPELKGQKMKFSLCNILTKTANFVKNQPNFYYSNFDDLYTTELFWNPSATPPANYVQNGYGFLGCYNTTNFEVQF